MASIFDEKNSLEATWFKFETIGDRLEGTLVRIGKRMNDFGKEQKVYQIRNADGQFLVSRAGVEPQLESVKIGQIVGFEFVSEKNTGKKSPAKIIKVYANESIVDEKFMKELAEREPVEDLDKADGLEEAKVEGEDEKEVSAEEAQKIFDKKDADSEVEKTSEEKMAEIQLLAVENLGASEDLEDVKTKVMEKTGLAFIEVNLTKILDKLKEV